MEYVYGGHLQTKAEVIAAIHQHDLSPLLGKLEPLIRPSIRLTYADPQPDVYPVGASRVGGLPDLPPGVEWPHWPGRGRNPASPLCFLAQINLAEAALFDVEHLLPASGMLYFFAATWVNCISDHYIEEGLWRVLYHDGDGSALRQALPPLVSDELRTNQSFKDYGPENLRFTPCLLTVELEMTLPNDNGTCSDYLNLHLSEEDSERYQALVLAVSPSYPGGRPIEHPPTHRMLGNSQCEQVYASHDDALLLLQLGTELNSADPSIYWEFGGRGYFFIQPDALQARDFTNVELAWEV